MHQSKTLATPPDCVIFDILEGDYPLDLVDMPDESDNGTLECHPIDTEAKRDIISFFVTIILIVVVIFILYTI